MHVSSSGKALHPLGGCDHQIWGIWTMAAGLCLMLVAINSGERGVQPSSSGALLMLNTSDFDIQCCISCS